MSVQNNQHGVRTPHMTTGPSGLLLGRTAAGPITVRLFRPRPTRVFMAAPDYVKWLVVFRSVALGAHVTVLTQDQRQWLSLTEIIRRCGGTIDVLRDTSMVPGQGRPYRPSLVVDEMGAVTPQHQLGAWQGLVIVGDPQTNSAVSDMRNTDLAVLAPLEGRAAENVRRAYAIGAQQLRQAQALGESEVVLASMRRVLKLAVPPAPLEYQLLFAG